MFLKQVFIEGECNLFIYCWLFFFSLRYPWGQEAFEKAKAEDKPIFLSGKKFILHPWSNLWSFLEQTLFFVVLFHLQIDY